MATELTYATTAELKTALSIPDGTDNRRIGAVLEGISRAIDEICGWRFYTTAADETRYYTAAHGDVFFCPDPIVSLTTLATDGDADATFEDTWTVTTDYYLEPANGAYLGVPYTWIETTANGSYRFPVGVKRGVQLIGKFGWPAVPDQIREATILMGEKLFKRKDAVFGVMGVSELGIVRKIIREDNELNVLLTGKVRRVV